MIGRPIRERSPEAGFCEGTRESAAGLDICHPFVVFRGLSHLKLRFPFGLE